jgi:hypothetical protein
MEKFRMRNALIIISLVLTQSFNAVSLFPQQPGVAGDSPAVKPPSFLSCDPDWVDLQMKKMTTDQKIAQLLMVAAYSNRDAAHALKIDELITKYGIGGLIFFQGDRGEGLVAGVQTNTSEKRAASGSNLALVMAGLFVLSILVSVVGLAITLSR